MNLTTYLLLDAFLGEFDLGVVISGDSDLVEPIRVVHAELDRKVSVYCPNAKSHALQLAAGRRPQTRCSRGLIDQFGR